MQNGHDWVTRMHLRSVPCLTEHSQTNNTTCVCYFQSALVDWHRANATALPLRCCFLDLQHVQKAGVGRFSPQSDTDMSYLNLIHLLLLLLLLFFSQIIFQPLFLNLTFLVQNGIEMWCECRTDSQTKDYIWTLERLLLLFMIPVTVCQFDPRTRCWLAATAAKSL